MVADEVDEVLLGVVDAFSEVARTLLEVAGRPLEVVKVSPEVVEAPLELPGCFSQSNDAFLETAEASLTKRAMSDISFRSSQAGGFRAAHSFVSGRGTSATLSNCLPKRSQAKQQGM
jgi:hypothetical protein